MAHELIVHTDGGARGNPGPAAVGVVIEVSGKIIHQFDKSIGETTNNVAEYTAVVEALQYILTMNHKPPCIRFFLDSKLVVEQLNGNYKIKDAKLRELALKIRILEQNLAIDKKGNRGVITYHYTPRENNTQADLLVNQALDSM